MAIDFSDYDIYKSALVEDLETGDYIDLEGDSAWDEDSDEIESLQRVEVLDVYLDEDSEGEEIWRVWVGDDIVVNVPPGYVFSRLSTED